MIFIINILDGGDIVNESNLIDLSEKIYDYCGCLYPEGVIRSDQNCIFDHNQIKEIIFIGLKNDEEKKFKEKLVEFINNDEQKQYEKLEEIERL